jgi:hypothetical protein
MVDSPSVSFGDNVRIRSTPLTQQLRLADLVGNVHGETTPSVMGIAVIGNSAEDHAIHVFFDDRKEGFWFAPELLEFVDHAPGTEVTIDGVPKKWIRSATGEWVEIGTASQKPARRPWWKFW